MTANGGPGRNSLTILEHDKNTHWDVRHLLAHTKGDTDDAEDADWRSVFMGIAFVNEHSAWVSEGNSGKIALFDWSGAAPNGRRRSIDLNQKGFDDSYTGDLALDAERGMLYVVDQANFRIAVIDTHSRQVVASVKVGRLPFAMTLSPDRLKLYVTNLGMFEYQALPGADMKQARHHRAAFSGVRISQRRSRRRRGTHYRARTGQGPGSGRPERPRIQLRERGRRLDTRHAKSGGLHPYGSAFRAECARRQQPLGNPRRRGACVRL